MAECLEAAVPTEGQRLAQLEPGAGMPYLGTLFPLWSFSNVIITAITLPEARAFPSWQLLPLNSSLGPDHLSACAQVKAQPGPPAAAQSPWALLWKLTWRRGLPHAPDTGGSCSSGRWGQSVPPLCWGLQVRDTVWVSTQPWSPWHPGAEKGAGASLDATAGPRLLLPYRPPPYHGPS